MQPTAGGTPALKRLPLDVYKKITIIRNEGDSVTYEDGDGNLQRITDLGEAAATSGQQPASAAQGQGTKSKKVDIPTPHITTNPTYHSDVSADFCVPTSYIRHQRHAHHVAIDYNLDSVDKSFLLSHSCYPPNMSKVAAPFAEENRKDNNNDKEKEKENPNPGPHPTLTPTKLAHMMDLLEKATKYDAIISSQQAEKLLRSRIPSFTNTRLAPTVSLINSVHSHWVSRRCTLKKPLLRRYWPVTAIADTNPHQVFRPREKEKYNTRKKRQNDMDAFRKMLLLKRDFGLLKQMLMLIVARERMLRFKIELERDRFENMIFDCVDTSGREWESDYTAGDVVEMLAIPPIPKSLVKAFDGSSSSSSSKKKKRRRGGSGGGSNTSPNTTVMGPINTHSSSSSIVAAAMADDRSMTSASSSVASHMMSAASFNSNNNNNNNPLVPPTADRQIVPLFTHPLASRETFVTNWDNAVPYVTCWEGRGTEATTERFRHRPRVGRGGRVCIDRLPRGVEGGGGEHVVYLAGEGLPKIANSGVAAGSTSMNRSTSNNNVSKTGAGTKHQRQKGGASTAEDATGEVERLLDLMPPALDHRLLSRKVAEICAGCWSDDDGDDGQEVLVKCRDWVEAEDEMWGEERIVFGPL